MKALVVDDDLTSRMVLREILSRYGEVQTCEDGDEAVRVCRSAREQGLAYDLICMDLLMPRMGGIEALTVIRREEEHPAGPQPGDTKVIITTASDDSDTITQAFLGLCDAYVMKPVDARELVDIMHCLFPVESRGDLRTS
jgi:two-component system chemotaxis response regulator CheY